MQILFEVIIGTLVLLAIVLMALDSCLRSLWAKRTLREEAHSEIVFVPRDSSRSLASEESKIPASASPF